MERRNFIRVVTAAAATLAVPSTVPTPKSAAQSGKQPTSVKELNEALAAKRVRVVKVEEFEDGNVNIVTESL